MGGCSDGARVRLSTKHEQAIGSHCVPQGVNIA